VGVTGLPSSLAERAAAGSSSVTSPPAGVHTPAEIKKAAAELKT